ncbi:hypothetical protein [Vibrio splendidus]|uniref:hypothetical protein n=1 Tax=Vibrio splendidus TaxID=29497 RepID=UPI003D0BD6E9
MPVRVQLKSMYTYKQLVNLDTQTLKLLLEFERSIVHRHEKIVGPHIDLVTLGKHRDGIHTLIAALYRIPFSDSKVVKFGPSENLKHIHSIKEL